MSGYLGKLKFLVVEDNQFMRTIIYRVLNTLGAEEIVEFNNGEEAYERLNSFQADIAIVDWRMAPMDGLEFIKKIRNAPDSPNAFLPIIMVTAHAERGKIFAARNAGVTEFVVKPISAKALIQRIQAIVERPRPFVRTETFFGPDRRRKTINIEGEDRRGTGQYETADDQPKPDMNEAMSQDEINVAFNPDEAYVKVGEKMPETEEELQALKERRKKESEKKAQSGQGTRKGRIEKGGE